MERRYERNTIFRSGEYVQTVHIINNLCSLLRPGGADCRKWFTIRAVEVDGSVPPSRQGKLEKVIQPPGCWKWSNHRAVHVTGSGTITRLGTLQEVLSPDRAGRRKPSNHQAGQVVGSDQPAGQDRLQEVVNRPGSAGCRN
jgi:hypothetical protein